MIKKPLEITSKLSIVSGRQQNIPIAASLSLGRMIRNLIQIANPPSRQEIRLAFFLHETPESSGPRWLTSYFFQKAWGIIETDLSATIQDWYRKEKIPENLCRALICLIPKQSSPDTIKQYRPISLCNTIYKLITKILVNRVKTLIPEWISPNQNNFIKGRGGH